MRARGAAKADVCHACVTANRAGWQPEHGSWKVHGGVDLGGDALDVYVNIEADLIVRTVF